MKYYISLLAVLFLCSCEEPLNFNNSQFFDIQDILESVNCRAECEETADCEGQTVKMIGTIDEANISAATMTFFMEDRSESTFDIEIRVDSTAADEVFALVGINGGSDARITAVLQGEDGTGSNCQREIFMIVDDVTSIDIIE